MVRSDSIDCFCGADWKEEMLAAYDKGGDGELSDIELIEASKMIGKEMQLRRGRLRLQSRMYAKKRFF